MGDCRYVWSLVLSLVLATALHAERDPAWFTDLALARSTAAQLRRPLLVCFLDTGASEFSRRFAEEVGATTVFRDWTQATVVVCWLERRPGATALGFDAAVTELHVVTFPTVFLFDGDDMAWSQLGYEQRTARDYVADLTEALAGRRAWRADLARLAAAREGSLVERATRMFRDCDWATDDELVSVASYLFEHDEEDTTGLRGEVAEFLAQTDGPLTRPAAAYLKSRATAGDAGRYGFVLLARSEQDFRELLRTAQQLKPGAGPSPAVRTTAARLYGRLKVARPMIRDKQVLASLYMRFGITLACVGKGEKAERALDRAIALGAPAPVVQGYRDFVRQMAGR